MRAMQDKLSQSVRRLVAEYWPERIILFGSRAKGDPDQEEGLHSSCSYRRMRAGRYEFLLSRIEYSPEAL